MQDIGQYQGRRILWTDFQNLSPENLPDKDWLCLAIANQTPDLDKFSNFVRTSIDRGILEFKGQGRFGELLHDVFDETMVDMEVNEPRPFIEVMTTGNSDENLADTFWQCFFVTCLPETADLNNIKIVCMDLDAVDRREELGSYIQRFESGWLPPD
jgi:hypothetical protein